MRNNSIDILKFFCAILVVILHCGICGFEVVRPITCCAVPCFFMISGYLTAGQNEEIKIRKGIKRITILMLWSTMLFLGIKVCMSIIAPNAGYTFVPSKREWLDFLIFNENPWGFHLWYIGAYLYVLIFSLPLVNREFVRKICLWIVPLLILTELSFGSYSRLLFGTEFNFLYTRNFALVGLPCFWIGMGMRWNNVNFKLKTAITGGGNLSRDAYHRVSTLTPL